MADVISVFSTDYIIWGVAVFVLLIIEATTVNLTTIWFAAGALFAGILALLGASVAVQIIAFVLVTGLCLFFTKPLVDKHFKKNEPKTNKDTLIGQKALVHDTINNIDGTGYIRINDVMWSARSIDGSVIEADTLVVVKEIKGNKLIVAVSDNK